MSQVPSFFETPSSERFKGIWAWLVTTDHKRIALLYLYAILFWFVIAMFLGLYLLSFWFRIRK